MVFFGANHRVANHRVANHRVANHRVASQGGRKKVSFDPIKMVVVTV